MGTPRLRSPRGPGLDPARASASASVGVYETPLQVDPFAIPVEDKLSELERPVRARLARGKPIHSAAARSWRAPASWAPS